MPLWTSEHADLLEQLDKDRRTTTEMSVIMSKHFKTRITPSQVSKLMSKMRVPNDPLFRDLPYRSPGVRVNSVA